MSHLLAPLCLLPPSLDTAWSGVAPPDKSHAIPRHNDTAIRLQLPLVWFDPPWHRLALGTADALACAVAGLGITVSALHRDVAAAGQQSRFFDGGAARVEQDQHISRAPRMLPYRPERYGLSVEDFDECQIIDVRLGVSRDRSGGFVFSQVQIQRWEATADGAPLAGGGTVPAATFPPDVMSLDQLGSKILQLRKLAPAAAIFVSVGPFRVADEIRRLLASRTKDKRSLPDGLVVRLDQAALTPLQLAEQTQSIRASVDAVGETELPLCIVPGEVTADDAAKLVALGADSVAVDSWCDELVDELCYPSDSMAAAFGYPQHGVVISSDEQSDRLAGWVRDALSPQIERFTGLCLSLSPDPRDCLGTFDALWAKALGVKMLGAGSMKVTI